MIFMVGNKQDLESEREVSREAALRFQRENGIKYFTETSAKSGDNVETLFLDASKFLFKQLQSQLEGTTSQGSASGAESWNDQSSMGGEATGPPPQVSKANSNSIPPIEEEQPFNLQTLKPEEDFTTEKKKGCKC